MAGVLTVDDVARIAAAVGAAVAGVVDAGAAAREWEGAGGVPLDDPLERSPLMVVWGEKMVLALRPDEWSVIAAAARAGQRVAKFEGSDQTTLDVFISEVEYWMAQRT